MEDNRQRYPVACPSCGKTIYACKSLFQEMGMNDMGAGTCIHCETNLHLTYNEETQSMEAIPFREWINQRKGETVGESEQEGQKTN